MMIFLLILLSATLVILILLWAISFHNQEELKEITKELGAPAFEGRQFVKRTVDKPIIGSTTWIPTCYGVQEFTIVAKNEDDTSFAVMNKNLKGMISWDDGYFSASVASKLKIDPQHRGAFRLRSLYARCDFVPYGPNINKWISEETILGLEDFMDASLFVFFIFDGFQQPYEYYKNYNIEQDIEEIFKDVPSVEKLEENEQSASESTDLDPKSDTSNDQ